MSVKRRILMVCAATLLGTPAVLSGLVASSAMPREACNWGTNQFCSEYGNFYWAICAAFSLALVLSLWAIHRWREG